MADRKGWKGERGRFWNSFSISWTWGREFRANKNKNQMFQPDPISSQRGGFKAKNTLPQLVPVPLEIHLFFPTVESQTAVPVGERNSEVEVIPRIQAWDQLQLSTLIECQI